MYSENFFSSQIVRVVLLAIIGALSVGVEKGEEKKGGWEDGS